MRKRSSFLATLLLNAACGSTLVLAWLPTPAPKARDPHSLLPQLEQYIQKGMAQTKVPGLAVAVVYKDEIIFQRGFRLRNSARTEQVDVDTVFQIASSRSRLLRV